jgi:lysophospholipase L1-like esterase
MRVKTIARGVLLACSLYAQHAAAQTAPLADRDGNGSVELLAFGDSITYGVGDDTPPGDYVEEINDAGYPRGYPVRLSAGLGVSVINAGVPGEVLSSQGVNRFPSLIGDVPFDTVLIMEGTNDAIFKVDSGTYARSLQKMINVARAEGKGIVLLTVLQPTALHASQQPFTNAYSAEVRELAYLNELSLIDTESAFIAACPDYPSCLLLNLPEGLHPNVVGYDTLGATIVNGLQGSGSK